MTERTIEYVPLDLVIPADQNPKKHDKTIQHSMDRFGYTQPVLIDERTGKLIAGHGRLEALKTLRDRGDMPPDGIGEDWSVPVIRGWASANDAEAAAALIGDNQLTILGGWDDRELFQMLDCLDDLDGVGFTLDDLDELGKKHNGSGGLPSGDADSDAGERTWGVIVQVENETDQKELLESLSAQGLKVRAMMS